MLGDLIESVLGFPAEAYFPQFSKGGLKPDLTPMDTIAHPFVLDAAFVGVHPKSELVSVRIDPTLALVVETEGTLGRARLEQGALRFRHARKETARVEGPEPRLALLRELIERRDRPLTHELATILLPNDLDSFAALLDAEVAEVARLLAAGRTLVEVAERLVCRLYDLPPGLEDEVIAHAVARADAS